jgi:hypothetical protein
MAIWTITVDGDDYLATPDTGDAIPQPLLKSNDKLTLKALARAVYLEDRVRFPEEGNTLTIADTGGPANDVRVLVERLAAEGF